MDFNFFRLKNVHFFIYISNYVYHNNYNARVQRSKSCSCLHDKAFELGNSITAKQSVASINKKGDSHVRRASRNH